MHFPSLLFLLVSSIFVAELSSAANVNVTVRQGTIKGITTDQTWEFRGIRYATAKRWGKPIDSVLAYPNGTYDATNFGAACPQAPQAESNLYIPTPFSEDCLFLNVFTPNTTKSGLEVLFFCHGGGTTYGASSQSNPPLYNGSTLVSHSNVPVIVVTINYRLGALGTLYLDALANEDRSWPTSGNYLILDVVSALRWVNRNIAAFGGDPKKVTIFGESAGGNLAVDVPTASLSLGLVRGFISESGTAGIMAAWANASVAAQRGLDLAKQCNCTLAGVDVVGCMRNLSWNTLVNVQGSVQLPSVMDGYLFKLYPPQAYQMGLVPGISGVFGSNVPDLFADCQLSSAAAQADAATAIPYASNTMVQWGVPTSWVNRVLSAYGVANCSAPNCCATAMKITYDYAFVCNARRIMNAIASGTNTTNLYHYSFDCHPTCPGESGICQHTSELAYVFGEESTYLATGATATTPINCQWSSLERTFSNNVIREWVGFAATMQPPSWPSFISTQSSLNITPWNTFSPIPFSVQDHHCDMWDALDQELQAAAGFTMPGPRPIASADTNQVANGASSLLLLGFPLVWIVSAMIITLLI